MGSLGGENLGRETTSIGKVVFAGSTGMTCLSLLFKMRTEKRCQLFLEEVAVG